MRRIVAASPEGRTPLAGKIHFPMSMKRSPESPAPPEANRPVPGRKVVVRLSNEGSSPWQPLAVGAFAIGAVFIWLDLTKRSPELTVVPVQQPAARPVPADNPVAPVEEIATADEPLIPEVPKADPAASAEPL